MALSVSSSPTLSFQGTAVHLCREDITELEVDGFVYYAQPDLVLGSGIGGAIAVRGGPSIQKELSGIVDGGEIPAGEAVVTDAGKLKARYIIHAVGPRFRESDTREKLRGIILRCLELADEAEMTSLAFPLMGAGYYGIPPAVSAQVMLEVFRSRLQMGSNLKEIFICVLDTPQYNAVEAAMAALG